MSRIRSLVLALAVLSPAERASAHDWYPVECCQELDCSPVEVSSVLSTEEGWLIVESGELIGFGDKRLKQSPDTRFHICLESFWEVRSATRCLFIPQPES